MNARLWMARRCLAASCAIAAACTVLPLAGQDPDASSPPDVEAGEGTGATEASGSGAGGSDPGADHPETYLDFAIAGGALMVPIGLASLLWLTFLGERLIALQRRRILPGSYVRAVAELPRGPVASERVAEICRRHPSSGARILLSAVEHLDGPRGAIDEAVNNAAQREVHSMRRYVRLFAVIAAVTPLLGLLGTVTGMIQAFREVAIQGLGSGQALAPGIYKALVTTAGGLIVAIPALLTYHWLMSRIDNYVHAIDTLVVDFIAAHRPPTDGARESAVEEPAGLGAGAR